MPFYSKEDGQRKAKRWSFTINNYTDDDIEMLKKIQCEFLVFGKEVAPTTGTHHIQGYVEFQIPKRRQTVSNLMKKRAYLDVAGGTEGENIEYCTKEGDYWMSDPELMASYQFYRTHPLPDYWTKQERFEFIEMSNHEQWTEEDLKFYIKEHDKRTNFLLNKYSDMTRKELFKKDWENSF